MITMNNDEVLIADDTDPAELTALMSELLLGNFKFVLLATCYEYLKEHHTDEIAEKFLMDLEEEEQSNKRGPVVDPFQYGRGDE